MGLERAPRKISRENNRDAGNYLRRAVVEVANRIGGGELVGEISKTVYDRTVLIPTTTIDQLEREHPGSGEEVFSLAQEIKAKHTRRDIMRLLTLRKPIPSEELLKESLPDSDKSKPKKNF